MIFEDKLVALIRNTAYTISQGHRLYEIDPFGLMYFNLRCTGANDPSEFPGTCSSDSKRGLDNYSFFNNPGYLESQDDGLYNFANVPTEEIIDVYIDQQGKGIIFVQVDSLANKTRFYISPFKQVERRTITDLILPTYFFIGEISGHVAYRSVRQGNAIYTLDLGSPQTIYKTELNIQANLNPSGSVNYTGSSLTSQIITTYSTTPVLLDICYDINKDKLVGLTSTSIAIFDGSWSLYPIASSSYTREHRSITYDYINDLYVIGNLSGVGNAYDFRGPTRSLINLNNILNDASAFTIVKGTDLANSIDVPYFTIENIEQYRYPLIFPIDNPNGPPTLPYKTYCHFSKVRFYEMNGLPRIVASDDFIYWVNANYATGELYPESSFIHRTLYTYSSYASESEIIDGVLSVIAVADKDNAISTDPNQISKWLSFDYAPYVDPECSKVLVNNIQICHERAAKCVGAASLVENGDFLDGMANWTDLDGNIFTDPFDSDIWSEEGSTVTLETVPGIRQAVNTNDLIEIRIKINAIEPVSDTNAGVVIKFYNGVDIVYEENVTIEDLDSVPSIFITDFAIDSDAFSIELNERATSAVIDYILLCDIVGEKSCKPGYDKISYDPFIEDNGMWIKGSDPSNNCGIVPPQPDPPPPPVPPAIPPPPTLPNSFDAWYSSLEGIFHFGYLAGNTAPVLYLRNNQINNPGNVTENSIMGVTLDKVNKKVYWLEKKYPIGATFADGILHVADQTDVTSDRILTTLQGIGFPGGGENVRTVHQRFAHYGAFICYVTFKESWLGTGPTKLVVLNTEGQELRSTNLDAILPNSRTYFRQLTIDKDSIYISGEEVINGQIRSVVLRINATSLLLIGKYYYTNSLSGNRPYISMINGPMAIDYKNKFIYFCDTLDNYFGSNQSIQGGLFRINTEAIVGTLPGEGYTQRFILGSNPTAKLPVIAMDVDRDGNLLVWRYIRENNTIKYIISLVRVADLSITDLPLSPFIPPNTIYPSPCCDPLVPEQTWPPIFANAQ